MSWFHNLVCRTKSRKFSRKHIKRDDRKHKKLVNLYEQYVSLLGEEIEEMAIILSTHNYVSTRYKQGKKLRRLINKYREKVYE